MAGKLRVKILDQKEQEALMKEKDEYLQAAARGRIGLADLTEDERQAVLEIRFRKASGEFLRIPSSENWTTLYDLMCAVQNERNERAK